MHCPECKGQDCIHIEIRLKQDDPMQFYSCRLCEAKWWETDHGTIELDEVLTRASHKPSK